MSCDLAETIGNTNRPGSPGRRWGDALRQWRISRQGPDKPPVEVLGGRSRARDGLSTRFSDRYLKVAIADAGVIEGSLPARAGPWSGSGRGSSRSPARGVSVPALIVIKPDTVPRRYSPTARSRFRWSMRRRASPERTLCDPLLSQGAPLVIVMFKDGPDLKSAQPAFPIRSR